MMAAPEQQQPQGQPGGHEAGVSAAAVTGCKLTLCV